MQMKNTTPSPASELVSMRALQLMLGIRSRQTVYNKIRNDPAFPKPRRTGSYSVAWIRREVLAYINSLPTAELDGFDAIERRRPVASRVS
jgi:predicted DNA-binding transcriptional regulator AlpA